MQIFLAWSDTRSKCRTIIISSAGLDPQPIDPATLVYMKQKGIDLSRQTSKGVHQIPNLDHYQFIVALSPEAKKVFPTPPTKTICLDWSVIDPSSVKGTATEDLAVFEQTFQSIRSHIQDLVEAILGNKSD